MSKSSIEHPSINELAAFVEGSLSDAGRIEAHLDTCHPVRDGSGRSDRTAHMASEGLIPTLSVAERSEAKERLRRIVNRSSESGASANDPGATKESKPSALPGRGIGSVLGAVGESWA